MSDPLNIGRGHAVSVSIGGLRIAAQISGSGDPVLLLNGMSRPMATWAELHDAFRGRTIITFDAPGVGASQTPILPYSMVLLSELAAYILDEFGAPRADVVGFSFGGAVAQQVAADYPGRVNRLVLLSTSCGLGSVPARPLDAARIMWSPSPDRSWSPAQALGMMWQITAVSMWSSIPLLGSIRAPTLVLCGNRDSAVPSANSRILAARIPDARLVTISGGHDLQKRGLAAVVCRYVKEFLDAT